MINVILLAVFVMPILGIDKSPEFKWMKIIINFGVIYLIFYSTSINYQGFSYLFMCVLSILSTYCVITRADLILLYFMRRDYSIAGRKSSYQYFQQYSEGYLNLM